MKLGTHPNFVEIARMARSYRYFESKIKPPANFAMRAISTNSMSPLKPEKYPAQVPLTGMHIKSSAIINGPL